MDLYGRPQTVLKTAFLTSANVYRSRLKMETCSQPSADVRSRSLRFANLAVVLAVSVATRPRLSDHRCRLWLDAAPSARHHGLHGPRFPGSFSTTSRMRATGQGNC